jgi:ATP-binding cassette subfamily B multidrug efflux pump
VITSVWYILVYGTSAALLLASASPWLAIPIALWFVGYLLLLRIFVPRMRDRSKEMSESRSQLTGRIVDSYTNILTVKLFARSREEDAYVREALEQHTGRFHRSLRLNTLFGFCLSTLNATMMTSTAGIAMLLWTQGRVDVGTIAMAVPLTWQIVSVAGWVAYQITAIFENIGVVQEGMMTIARPIGLVDAPGAKPLEVKRGEIAFKAVRFGYGRAALVDEHGNARPFSVIDELTLTVKPGEKVGLVGRSGAGKSTLVNLMLRFFDLEDGAILIDGQDIAQVTQDTSLLHRSIRDNVRYGRPSATDAEIETAARLAHAHEFILDLEDWKGRRGYDAQVGERGVKLSGGQRQRVAIARVILKDAPILVLDEATSALDSEVEAAIQQSLGTLIAGKTVIAIAHRLSTIARMDRLVVLDHGRIVEQGTHGELLRANGHYAALWQRQSGGFIDAGDEAQAAE